MEVTRTSWIFLMDCALLSKADQRWTCQSL